MADYDRPVPNEFPVVVTVNRVKVEVVLMLRPGVAVTVKETNITTDPVERKSDG